MTLKPGPYFDATIAPGQTAPFYALRFDKAGRSEGPLTQQALVAQLTSGDFTDVYVFSHGWNNDWKAALERYKDFMGEFRGLRETHDFERPHRPLLAGIFWPSTALVMPWERGPQFAGDEGEAEADAIDLALLSGFAEGLPPGDTGRFYELAESESLGEDDATELLRLLSGVAAHGDPEVAGDPARDVEEMLASWAQLEAALAAPALPRSPDDFGAVGTGVAAGPQAAGFLDKLNPRNLLRGLTVWQMKDRAGTVGADGVGPVLRKMLSATDEDTRFHLVGHSYGARVVLNAVGRPSGGALPRAVNSLLLLQPAVNHLCFADAQPPTPAGGYRNVLAAVKQPILSTFSGNDFPLTKTFHLALRRGKDLREAQIAAEEPPSEYAALGGYGPRGFKGWKSVDIKDPDDVYDLGANAPEVWAVNGTRTISGHGAVVNKSTAWALFNLARA
jgi:hypothetical protein